MNRLRCTHGGAVTVFDEHVLCCGLTVEWDAEPGGKGPAACVLLTKAEARKLVELLERHLGDKKVG